MSATTGETAIPEPGISSPFVSTRWTVVLAAAEPESPEAREAFGNLYRDYWPPLYAFVRRRGYEPPAAEDITQDFFAALLEKQQLNGVTRVGGKFRSFLLTALKNHLANEWDRSRAARRGGGVAALTLDESAAESAYQTVATLPAEPDELFDRQWALSVLALTRQRLEAELAQAGKRELASTLGPSLLGGSTNEAYPELAAKLGLTEGALKVTIHRLRKRFGELLRQELARTVDDPAAVPAELRYLIEVVGRGG